jgi:hypothetical protein
MLEDEIDRVLNERYIRVELNQSGVEKKLFVEKSGNLHVFFFVYVYILFNNV